MVSKPYTYSILALLLALSLVIGYALSTAPQQQGDVSFHLGSSTYSFYSEGGGYGFLLFGPYRAFGSLSSYPTKKEEREYHGEPTGKIVALWQTHTNEKDSAAITRHYYYAASAQGESIILPPQSKDHGAYEIYGFFGHLRLFEEGFDPERYKGEVIRYNVPGRPVTYRAGHADSFYYFVRSRPRSTQDEPAWTRHKVWHELKGIEVTKEQFNQLTCLNINKPDCTPVLTEKTLGLTEAQRTYVETHPVSKEDFSELIHYLDNIPVNPYL